MDIQKELKIIYAFGIGAIVAIIFVVIATILGELYKDFKDLLAVLFGHHWIGKSVIAMALFLAFSFLALLFPLKPTEKCLSRLFFILSFAIILGSVIIAGFFILHWYKIV